MFPVDQNWSKYLVTFSQLHVKRYNLRYFNFIRLHIMKLLYPKECHTLIMRRTCAGYLKVIVVVIVPGLTSSDAQNGWPRLVLFKSQAQISLACKWKTCLSLNRSSLMNKLQSWKQPWHIPTNIKPYFLNVF